MPDIPATYGQATLNFTGDNVPRGAAIVLGFANVSDASPLVCAQDIYAKVAICHGIISTGGVVLVGCDVKLGPNDTGPIANYVGTPQAGSVGPASLSPGSAFLVEKVTATGGRRGKGRIYWPGVYDGWADQDGGVLAAAIPTIQGALNDLLDDLEVENMPMSLLHSPGYTWDIVGGQPRRIYDDPYVGPAPYPVLNLNLDPVIATQRRRLRG